MQTITEKDARDRAKDIFDVLLPLWNQGINRLGTPPETYSQDWLYDDFWKAGNTLDGAVSYLFSTLQYDVMADLVNRSYTIIFNARAFISDNIWRDDYGWWGVGFINAYAYLNGIAKHKATAALCLNAAKRCWDEKLVLSAQENEKYASRFKLDDQKYKEIRDAGGGYGVWNNDSVEKYMADKTLERVPNTVTNGGFWALSCYLWEQVGDEKYLTAMAKTLDWFYYFFEVTNQGENSLFNKASLYRETANPWVHTQKWCYDQSRAWTADQGAILYCLWKCQQYVRDKDDKGRDRNKLAEQLYSEFLKGFEHDGKGNTVNGLAKDFVIREYETKPIPDGYDSNCSNYNDNYSTGSGVMMRYFGRIADPAFQKKIAPFIAKSTEAAWSRKQAGWITSWNNDFDDPTKYQKYYPFANGNKNQAIWKLAFQVSALDLFTAAVNSIVSAPVEAMSER
jgi:hypothetical protein